MMKTASIYCLKVRERRARRGVDHRLERGYKFMRRRVDVILGPLVEKEFQRIHVAKYREKLGIPVARLRREI